LQRIYLYLAAAAAATAAVIALHQTVSGPAPGSASQAAATATTAAGPPPLPEWLLGDAPASLTVASPAWPRGGRIPPRYTCDDSDVNPPLRWGNVPATARSILVLVYDPDAPSGFFIHWVIYNIDPRREGLPAAVPRRPMTSYGAQAVNDFGRVGYGGPCPPSGRHRYVFLVLALDDVLRSPPGSPARRVLEEARGHVLAYGYTWGTYSRQSQ